MRYHCFGFALAGSRRIEEAALHDCNSLLKVEVSIEQLATFDVNEVEATDVQHEQRRPA